MYKGMDDKSDTKSGIGTIAIIDDDKSIRKSLKRVLLHEGYEVLEGVDGRMGIDLAPQADLMILDVTMPNLGGFDVCRQLRAGGNKIPILCLTARHATRDRVEGLDAGADDYLVKPFELDELLARVRSLLRRSNSFSNEEKKEELSYGGLILDQRTRQVTRDLINIDLTKTEFDLLEIFMEEPGRVFNRDQLYERVWGYGSSMASNSLDVYIGYLRRKIANDDKPRLLETIRGVGYVLRS
jgi:two-component system response regulator MprA